jgi:hypothetical protein
VIHSEVLFSLYYDVIYDSCNSVKPLSPCYLVLVVAKITNGNLDVCHQDAEAK